MRKIQNTSLDKIIRDKIFHNIKITIRRITREKKKGTKELH